ncbi:MAG: hypothetical protein ACLUQN_10415, partial [Megasphaera sp.]
MKARNGFFSFSMMMLAVLTLSLIMTTTLLALNCLSLATIYEKKVRLHYLAESAVLEGWQVVQQNPAPYLEGQSVRVPLSTGLTEAGETVRVEARFDYGYLMGLAVDEATSLEQTCC